MTFLNPLVLFGLIAASIPIIIHLLNLRKLKVIEFSSLQFLKEMQKNKMRKIKVKQILLLILRTLAIVFLVLAFSRPTVREINLAGLGSEVKNTIVILIDDTPSMSVTDNRGEYFLQAKKLASKILSLAEEGDEIYFLKFSELNPQRNEFEQTSRNLAIKEIENLEISDVSKNFLDVFISVSKILENSRNLSKEVYILTDLQKTNFPEKELQNLKFDRVFDQNTRIYFFKIGKKDAFNISIDSLTVTSRIFEINKPINVSASITNYSNESASNVNANLFLNEKKVAQKGLDIQKNSSGFFSFTGQIKEHGFNLARLEIEDDDMLKDNVRYFNFFVPEKIKVLMVSENQQDLIFANLVLSQTLDDNSELLYSITTTPPQFFNSLKPESFDIIIISSPEKIFNLNLLKDYISKGGTAVIFPSSNSSPLAFGKALESLGLNSINGVSGSKENKTYFTRFGEIDFNHPIFTGIFNEKRPKQIESPKIFYSFNYKPTLNGREIITLENGYSFLCEEKIGEGSLLIFTSALDLNWSEFPIKPIFVPLINRTAQYSNLSFNYSFIAGENVTIRLKKKITDLKLIDPEGKEKVVSEIESSDGKINLGKLNKTGNYKLISNNELIGAISININPLEANLAKLEESKLIDFAKNSFPKGKLKIVSADTEPSEFIKQERYGTELWKLFLFLVILTLALEMVVAKASKKDLIEFERS
ncbi:MAG: BatA domain-containing protein [Ignavibacteria bacterium]|nr:BatA domain-containing protein [Ignavibacteria bacterium]